MAGAFGGGLRRSRDHGGSRVERVGGGRGGRIPAGRLAGRGATGVPGSEAGAAADDVAGAAGGKSVLRGGWAVGAAPPVAGGGDGRRQVVRQPGRVAGDAIGADRADRAGVGGNQDRRGVIGEEVVRSRGENAAGAQLQPGGAAGNRVAVDGRRAAFNVDARSVAGEDIIVDRREDPGSGRFPRCSQRSRHCR